MTNGVDPSVRQMAPDACGKQMESAHKAYDIQRRKDLEGLVDLVLMDCQPKSQEDAVYVSIKWRQAVLESAGKLA